MRPKLCVYIVISGSHNFPSLLPSFLLWIIVKEAIRHFGMSDRGFILLNLGFVFWEYLRLATLNQYLSICINIVLHSRIQNMRMRLVEYTNKSHTHVLNRTKLVNKESENLSIALIALDYS